MTKKAPCYTCKKSSKAVIETEDTIPEWYKKSKNAFSPYLAVPNVIVCKKEYNPKINFDKWKEKTPPSNGSQIVLKQNINYNNKWIFYWASDSVADFSEVKSAEEAYEKLDNKGLIKTDKNGLAKFVLNCPQPYNVGGTIYAPHLHFIHLNDKKLWSVEKVETIEVHCRISFSNLEEMLESKDHLIINCMSSKIVNGKDVYEIPGSLRLEGDIDKKKNFDKLLKQIGKEVEEREELKDIKKNKKVPIVIYSVKYGEDTISRKLKMKLLEEGFTNLIEYNSKSSGWMDEYDEDKDDSEDKKEEEPEEEEPEEEEPEEEEPEEEEPEEEEPDDEEDEDEEEDEEEMFKVGKDEMNEETLVFAKDGDIELYEHNISTGELTQDGEKIGLWNGKTIVKDEDSKKSKKGSDSDSDSDSDSEDKKQKGGGISDELTRFKKLLNGGTSVDVQDNIELTGGGYTFKGHGFTFH